MRFPRLKAHPASPVAFYHCVSRVVNREFVFGPQEKEHFTREMRRFARFCGLRVVTFCVMSNHFHLLLEVPKRPEVPLSDAELLARVDALERQRLSLEVRQQLETLREAGDLAGVDAYKERFFVRMWDVSAYMKLLKQRFTQWFNGRHQRRGTLWEERFKSVLVEGAGEALATMAAYIDLNPVRAQMVVDPKDYRWCGYAEAMAGGKEALEGLRVIDEAREAHVARPAGSRGTLENYRVWVYGKGEQREGLLDEVGTVGAVGRVGIEAKRVAEMRARKGKLTRWEMLRCRVRYFSDGMVLGSREWVEEVFAQRRERFSERRESGARPLRGVEAPGLRTLRDLRVRAVG